MREGNVNQLHLRVCQEVCVRPIGPGDVKAPREGIGLFLRAGADGQALHVFHLMERAGRLFGNVAGTEDSNIHHNRGKVTKKS